MKHVSRRTLAWVISLLLVIAALGVTAVIYVVSGGTVLLVVLPLVAPVVILLAWSALSGRNDGPGA
jgi:hypothetical protein